jgi:hypothetical protein
MPHVSHRDLGREMDRKRWKTGKRDLGSKDGKVGHDKGLLSRFPVHFPFFSNQ